MDSRKTFDVIADVLQTGNPSGGLPKEYGRSAQESFGAKFHRKKRKNRHSKWSRSPLPDCGGRSFAVQLIPEIACQI